MKRVTIVVVFLATLAVVSSFSEAKEDLQLIITVTSMTPTTFDMVHEGVTRELGLVTPQEFAIDAAAGNFIFRSQDSTKHIVVTASRERGVGGVTGSAPIVMIQVDEDWISTVATDELQD